MERKEKTMSSFETSKHRPALLLEVGAIGRFRLKFRLFAVPKVPEALADNSDSIQPGLPVDKEARWEQICLAWLYPGAEIYHSGAEKIHFSAPALISNVPDHTGSWWECTRSCLPACLPASSAAILPAPWGISARSKWTTPCRTILTVSEMMSQVAVLHRKTSQEGFPAVDATETPVIPGGGGWNIKMNSSLEEAGDERPELEVVPELPLIHWIPMAELEQSGDHSCRERGSESRPSWFCKMVSVPREGLRTPSDDNIGSLLSTENSEKLIGKANIIVFRQ